MNPSTLLLYFLIYYSIMFSYLHAMLSIKLCCIEKWIKSRFSRIKKKLKC